MKPVVKRFLLGGTLGATLCAAWFAPGQEDASTAGAAATGPALSAALPAPRRAARAAAPVFVDVLPIRARTLADDEGPDPSLFGSTQWGGAPVPAAAVMPVAAAPAAVTAPPLPFRVMGSFEQAGQTVVFLQQNDLNHAVRTGDTIGETYKVESIEGAVMTLRYLPLGQVQTLELGHTLQDKRELE
jgi:hypothetical protein